ncbi:hypothetical protein [uncultured Phenylobacterium sp.]|uniref:hypothetical protein n=1 Tax=uncultured Phenylobacterium sp. TaxID=349273 RepID=UPI0025E53E45|nr:hypothetical protein [uncultured Phenylobacterium sp.]
MVSVQLRNTGDGLWSTMTLPTSVQVAQTIAGAAKQLDLADQVRIQPAAPPPRPGGVDVRV